MPTYHVTQYHQEIQDWIALHGVEPGDVLIPSDITVDTGQVTFTRLARDEQGAVIFVDAAGVVETVTVTQVAPWPLPEGAEL